MLIANHFTQDANLPFWEKCVYLKIINYFSLECTHESRKIFKNRNACIIQLRDDNNQHVY